MDWHEEYPSTVLRTKLDGDEAACREIMGFAHDLLFRVKDMMVNGGIKLKQLHGSLHFSDGSVIRASSIWGQDTISIYRPPGVRGKRPHCMVSLINVPQVVPPSRWYEDGVHTFPADPPDHPIPYKEEEGYAYFKIYYGIGIIDCPECWGSQLWSVCKTEKLMSDIGLVVGCRYCHPFIYDAEKGKWKYNGGDIPFKEEWTQTCGDPPHITYPADPDNHCLIGACQGEILDFDSDGNGAFFLLKVYTEWSCAGGPQIIDYWSKTGLGYMLLEVKIMEKGKPLCSAYEVMKVDCCEKRPEDRDLEIWWESLGSGPYTCYTCCYQPFMFVGSMVVCETPHLMGFWYLLWLAWWYVGFQTLYFINGACPPFEWTLTGPGSLVDCPPDHGSAEWFPPEDYMGCEDVVITTRDRCGSEHTIRASCCHGGQDGGPEFGPLGISYESLVLGFNQCQNLHNAGGCPPYSWSSGGVGTLEVDPNDKTGGSAVYCAPDSNPNCENNANISITDCCGNSASIEISITNNNYYIALRLCDFVVCNVDDEGNETGQIQCEWWYCDGQSTGPSCYTATGLSGPCPWCWNGPCDCTLSKGPPYGDWYVCTYGGKDFQCAMCEASSSGCHCGIVCDVRTPEMIAAGCCPPNPLTGQPM